MAAWWYTCMRVPLRASTLTTAKDVVAEAPGALAHPGGRAAAVDPGPRVRSSQELIACSNNKKTAKWASSPLSGREGYNCRREPFGNSPVRRIRPLQGQRPALLPGRIRQATLDTENNPGALGWVYLGWHRRARCQSKLGGEAGASSEPEPRVSTETSSWLGMMEHGT